MCEPVNRSRSREPILRATAVFSVVVVVVFNSTLTLKENGTRHGRGTHKKKNRLQTLNNSSLLIFLRTFTLVKIIKLTN